MLKRRLAFVIACVMAVFSLGLSGCASYTEGAATTAYAFVQKIVAQDYDAAYDYIYVLSNDVSNRQDFIDRYENIYSALEIQKVVLLDRNIEQMEGEENRYTLTYSLQMESALLGSLTYEYEAEVVSGPSGYSVLYDPSLILPMMEDGDKVRVTNQTGARGEIFAADGKLLASNDYAQSIYLDLDMEPDIEQVKSLLSSLLGLDPDTIQKRYDNAVENENPVQVLKSYPRDTLTDEELDQIKAVDGLGVDDSSLIAARYYPLSDNAAHTVGYVTSPTEAQLQADESLDEYSVVGQSGIEATYDETLRGTNGRMIFLEDGRGEVKEVLYEEPSSDGSDVHLTIDSELQNTAYTLLATNCGSDKSGVVLAMDYTTGDIKTMVSYPSFDPNQFVISVDQKLYDYYMSEESQKPLFSRATQALYMPGSTFKPFSSTAAIETGILTPDASPQLTIKKNEKNVDIWDPGDDGFSWGYPVISRVSTPTEFNFEVCMKSSDNIFFAYWALKTGGETFMAHMEKIGMGDVPAFELPLSKSNLLNEEQTLDNQLLAQMGYGMGQLSLTPVHMASLYSALMNGGTAINPTVVGKISKSDGLNETIEWENSTTVFRDGIMQQYTIDMMMPALRRVVTDGTAYEAQLADVSTLYAKTGTARIGESATRYVNWVIAIDTATNLIYIVIIDTEGDTGTAPKLAVLNGLIKPENYNNALMGSVQGETTTQDETQPEEDIPEDDTVQDDTQEE